MDHEALITVQAPLFSTEMIPIGCKTTQRTFDIRLTCLLCGRCKFTACSPHNCNHGFRKRRIPWLLVFSAR